MGEKITKRNLWWLACGALLVIFGVYLASFHIRHMRHDETLTFLFADVGTPIDIVLWMTRDSHPPLWWIFFWGWLKTVGLSEFSGRYSALLYTMIALAWVYRLGFDWFKHWRYGLFAMIVVSANLIFYRFTLEVRPYAFIFLLAVMSTWLLVRWLKQGTWRWALLYGVSASAMMYVHYYLAFFILSHMLIVLLERPSRERLTQYVGAGAFAFLLWSPWIPGLISQLQFLSSIAVDYGGSGVALSPAPTLPTSWRTIREIFTLGGNGYIYLVPIMFTFGIALWWREKKYWYLLIWAIVPQILVLIANQYIDLYTIRYIAYGHIAVAIASGVAIARLPKYVNYFALAGFVAFLVQAIPNTLPPQAPYRHLMDELALRASPNDIFYYDRVTSSPTDQFDRYFPAELQDQVIFDDYDAVIDRLPEADGVWHITQIWFAEGTQDRFRQLTPYGTLTDVIGECSHWCMLLQRIDLPPRQEPLVYPVGLDFYGGEVDVETNALDMTLWWKAQNPIAEPVSMGVQVLDANGQLIAQTDGTINDRYIGEVEPTALDPDRNFYYDERRITLPDNVPAGTYDIYLVVYNWQTSEHFLTTDNVDSFLVETVTIP
ncbi:MAG: glycosyltransferase family 39 protein [Chloroflexota bacterium]